MFWQIDIVDGTMLIGFDTEKLEKPILIIFVDYYFCGVYDSFIGDRVR